MLAPQIEYSDREERIEFIQERFHCKAPSCGGCGSCNLGVVGSNPTRGSN